MRENTANLWTRVLQVKDAVQLHMETWQADDECVLQEMCHAMLSRLLEYKQRAGAVSACASGLSALDVITCYRISAKFLVCRVCRVSEIRRLIRKRVTRNDIMYHEEAVLRALEWRVWDVYNGVARLMQALGGGGDAGETFQQVGV